jgi:hypothetical protein
LLVERLGAGVARRRGLLLRIFFGLLVGLLIRILVGLLVRVLVWFYVRLLRFFLRLEQLGELLGRWRVLDRLALHDGKPDPRQDGERSGDAVDGPRREHR